MSSSTSPTLYAERLKNWRCVRVRVTDRKQLPQEKSKVLAAAQGLGRQIYMSYRYPYLYARLGEKTGGESGAAEAGIRWDVECERA